MNLVRASWSTIDDEPASKDIRYRLRSVMARSVADARLPILRFLGSDSGCKTLPRPRSSSGLAAGTSAAWLSAPASGHQYGKTWCVNGRKGSQPFLFRDPPWVWGIVRGGWETTVKGAIYGRRPAVVC